MKTLSNKFAFASIFFFFCISISSCGYSDDVEKLHSLLKEKDQKIERLQRTVSHLNAEVSRLKSELAAIEEEHIKMLQ